MSIREPDSEPNAWKRRYYDSLEQAERREREWRRTEDALRTAISRLSLAADGLDPALDERLAGVRRAIRERADAGALQQELERLSAALVDLDAGRGPQRTAPLDVLRLLLEALELPPELEAEARALRKRLRQAGDGEIDQAMDAFAGFLQQALTGADGTPGRDAQTAAGWQRLFRRSAPAQNPAAATPGGRETLLLLLERLSLPLECKADADRLRHMLEDVSRPFDPAAAIRAFVDLFATIRMRMVREKQEIEHFLMELSERLRDVDLFVRGAEQLRSGSRRAGRHLEKSVQAEIQGLETSVREATDLQSLKLAVKQRLDAIVAHVEQHREEEELRHQEAQSQLFELKSRLHLMEQETARLHDRIRVEHNQALTDPLTGIPNRLAYEERVLQEVARWARFGTPLTLVLWDIDRFKRVNDDFGHKAGDKVLRTIATLLADNVRETDFLARFGGEEFALLMPGADEQAALGVADKLREAVTRCRFHYAGQDVDVTVSAGISGFHEGDNVEMVFLRADKALYKAKATGRNRCVVADFGELTE